MQQSLCDGRPLSILTVADLELHLRRINDITFNDLDGHTIEEAREQVRKDIELELRIRNMGLR